MNIPGQEGEGMKKGDRVFSIICMGLSLWLILESLKFSYLSKFGPGPGFLPFWLGIILGLIALFAFVNTFSEKRMHERDEPRLPGWGSLARVGLILLIMAGFALFVNSLGFILTVFIFVTILLFALEDVGFLKSLFYGVMFSACIFLIFRYWMELDLPKGLLGI
jgi:putative tricarboxylic transport membrane protein